MTCCVATLTDTYGLVELEVAWQSVTLSTPFPLPMSVVVGAGTMVVVVVEVVVDVVVEVVVLVDVVVVVGATVVVVTCGDTAPTSAFHGKIAAITTTAPTMAEPRLRTIPRLRHLDLMATRVDKNAPMVKSCCPNPMGRFPNTTSTLDPWSRVGDDDQAVSSTASATSSSQRRVSL